MSNNSTIKGLPLEQRVALHGELIAHGIVPSCINCLHKEERQDSEYSARYIMCVRYGSTPPFRVIVVGCTGWVQDIPF
jgi:hypothetical protein